MAWLGVHCSTRHAVSHSARYLKISTLCRPVGYQATLAVPEAPLTDPINKDGFKFIFIFTFCGYSMAADTSVGERCSMQQVGLRTTYGRILKEDSTAATPIIGLGDICLCYLIAI